VARKLLLRAARDRRLGARPRACRLGVQPVVHTDAAGARVRRRGARLRANISAAGIAQRECRRARRQRLPRLLAIGGAAAAAAASAGAAPRRACTASRA
jgi:hypothetical protein